MIDRLHKPTAPIQSAPPLPYSLWLSPSVRSRCTRFCHRSNSMRHLRWPIFRRSAIRRHYLWAPRLRPDTISDWNGKTICPVRLSRCAKTDSANSDCQRRTVRIGQFPVFCPVWRAISWRNWMKRLETIAPFSMILRSLRCRRGNSLILSPRYLKATMSNLHVSHTFKSIAIHMDAKHLRIDSEYSTHVRLDSEFESTMSRWYGCSRGIAVLPQCCRCYPANTLFCIFHRTDGRTDCHYRRPDNDSMGNRVDTFHWTV